MSSTPYDLHRELLADAGRLKAFAAAFGETISPEHAVLDLGSGTGILGLLACRAGARRVYSVDEGDIVHVSRQIGRLNGMDDRITYVKGVSSRIALPEQVDVIVADQVGPFGYEEGGLRYLDDARARLLKPGGLVLPSAVELHVAPIEAPETWGEIEFWKTRVAGFDVTPVFPLVVNAPHVMRIERQHLLGSTAMLASLDLTSPLPPRLTAEAVLTVERNGVLHGIGGWFSARLSPSVCMTNSPLAPDRLHRRNAYFPIGAPVGAVSGDRIRVVMRIAPAEWMTDWTVQVTSAEGRDKGTFSQSSWKGIPLSREDLERMRPDYRPRLTGWAEARRAALELCDGRRTVSDIEREIHARYPQIFQTADEAARFVAQVVRTYA